MKNKNIPVIIMMAVINQVGGGASSTPKNLGGKKQRLEKPVKTIHLAKDTFQFANEAAMKDISNWNTAIENKDLIPYPNIEGIETNNTEANIKTGRYTDYTLAEGVTGSSYRYDCSIEAYEAMISHLDTEYTRVFEISEAEEVICDVQTDGAIKGRKLSSHLISERSPATVDDVPFCNVLFKYQNKLFDIMAPELELTELEGIVDLAFEIHSASGTEVVFSASVASSGDNVSSLVQANLRYLEGDGETTEAITGLSYDADTQRYTATAAAFVTGTLSTDGVVTQTNIKYEQSGTAVTVS